MGTPRKPWQKPLGSPADGEIAAGNAKQSSCAESTRSETFAAEEGHQQTPGKEATES